MTQDDATAALEDVRVALKEARGVALDHDEEEADLMFERAIETLDHALSGYSLVPTEEIERLRRIEALRELSDAATPGRWHDPENGYIEGGSRHIADVRYRNGDADRAFIVAAVNYVRAALAATVPGRFEAGLDMERLARALDLCGIGEISGHLPSTWAETIAVQYAALSEGGAPTKTCSICKRQYERSYEEHTGHPAHKVAVARRLAAKEKVTP